MSSLTLSSSASSRSSHALREERLKWRCAFSPRFNEITISFQGKGECTTYFLEGKIGNKKNSSGARWAFYHSTFDNNILFIFILILRFSPLIRINTLTSFVKYQFSSISLVGRIQFSFSAFLWVFEPRGFSGTTILLDKRPLILLLSTIHHATARTSACYYWRARPVNWFLHYCLYLRIAVWTVRKWKTCEMLSMDIIVLHLINHISLKKCIWFILPHLTINTIWF